MQYFVFWVAAKYEMVYIVRGPLAKIAYGAYFIVSPLSFKKTFYTHPDFNGALLYFSNWGALICWGPGQVAPLPPPPLGGPASLYLQTYINGQDKLTELIHLAKRIKG